MRVAIRSIFLAGALAIGFTVGTAAQTGPVAQACKKEIAEFCASKGHGAAQTRTCLEAKRKSLSAACLKALETTGPRRTRPR